MLGHWGKDLFVSDYETLHVWGNTIMRPNSSQAYGQPGGIGQNQSKAIQLAVIVATLPPGRAIWCLGPEPWELGPSEPFLWMWEGTFMRGQPFMWFSLGICGQLSSGT